MNEKIKIRVEKQEDYEIVENLTRDSFWNVYRPGCTEHFVLNRFRDNPDFIPELSLILEINGEILGHIMFSWSKIQCDDEINLKKARNAVGCKEIAPIKQEELLGLTGYVRGGCSPLGMKRQFVTFIDELALLQEKICISGGQRGVQIIINPEDLAKACNATFVDLGF